jgi:hypothetical protein
LRLGRFRGSALRVSCRPASCACASGSRHQPPGLDLNGPGEPPRLDQARVEPRVEVRGPDAVRAALTEPHGPQLATTDRTHHCLRMNPTPFSYVTDRQHLLHMLSVAPAPDRSPSVGASTTSDTPVSFKRQDRTHWHPPVHASAPFAVRGQDPTGTRGLPRRAPHSPEASVANRVRCR